MYEVAKSRADGLLYIRSGGRTVGWFHLSPGRLLYVGADTPASAHAHHAVQLSLGLTGPIQVRHGRRGRWEEHWGVLLAPNVEHESRLAAAEVGRVLLLHVDPQSSEGRRIRATLPPRGIARLDELGSQSLRRAAVIVSETPSPTSARAWIDEAVSTLCGSAAPAAAQHPGVLRALRFLDDELARRPALAEVAAAARLSPGRLVHVFRDELGLPIRRYTLWLRLQRAAGLAAGGQTLSQAAHDAGFSDAAHLTRTFRKMFGLAPTMIFRGSQFVQDG